LNGDEGYIDNNEVIKNLLAIKLHYDNNDDIRKIKNQINFIHRLLRLKDKIKKFIESKDELESFIEMNEQILLEYQRKKGTNDNKPIYNVYLKRTYDLKFTNVLYGIQIRSTAKHIMIKYFDYCDKNNIKIYYCNIDSILIKGTDIGIIKQFISDKYRDLKIE
jgi:hypothetical protein